MTYTQKYTIVCMLQPQNVGDEFTYETWPIHVTLADVFAIDWQNGAIVQKLQQAIASFKPITLQVGEPADLGTVKVMMLQTTPVLQSLHQTIVSVLTSAGAVFNNPEFTLDGFVAHCTIQLNAQLQTGQHITINNLCIIDMFVDGDYTKRKIINVLPL